ncbi:ribbon-helix-helix domain-containing protein [Erwinia pyri]|uniref:Ribbon-helix-helix domain-containing protein n=1 Tax=Erwinia pyri TaxID=3062598 RepID=A0AA50DN31_9GAMM|nr:ribbon-helix-helix domain-containing protein [Erwinia sp. DE2]WLS79111.1 ribbon-helix-helix domain-containing protein [Erwinia sp. DE2]
MGQSQTRVITAHIPVEMAEKLDAMATNYDRSRGWLVKQALAAIIEQEEHRHRLTLEALQAVEEGRVVEHDDVVKWAASLGTDTQLSTPEPGK